MNIRKSSVFGALGDLLSTGSILGYRSTARPTAGSHLAVSSGREVGTTPWRALRCRAAGGPNNPSRHRANDVNRTIGNAVEKRERNSQDQGSRRLGHTAPPLTAMSGTTRLAVRQSLPPESRDGAAPSERIGGRSHRCGGSISTISPEG